MKKFFFFLNIFFLVDIFVYSNAFAYIDPGTGSIILQGLIAGIAAAGATISIYWTKIKSFFSKKKKNNNKQDLGD